MSERLVTPVSNNLEKYYTYREYISKYNRAMRGEFYFEALLIDYAMLEDRLRSMLYYMGALQTRDSIKINCKKTQGLLKKIVHDYSAKDESKRMACQAHPKKNKKSKIFITNVGRYPDGFGHRFGKLRVQSEICMCSVSGTPNGVSGTLLFRKLNGTPFCTLFGTVFAMSA